MKKLTEDDLAQFIGSESFYCHSLGLRYTDGVKFMAERAEAYWLIDAIASYQTDKHISQDPILKACQVWQLVVHDDKSVTLIVRADSDQAPAITQEIPCTDFPLPEITLWISVGTLMLPSEYWWKSLIIKTNTAVITA